MLRRLVGLAAVLAVVGSGLWLAGSVVARRAVGDWVAAQGPGAGYEAVRVGGYPFAYALRFDGLDLPRPPVTWRLPDVRAAASLVRPGMLDLELPARFTVEAPGGRVEVASDRLDGTVRVDPFDDVALLSLAADATALRVSGGAAGASGLGSGRLRMDREDADAARYAVALDLDGADLPPALREGFAAGVAVGGSGDGSATVRAVIGFDRPWDARAASGTRPMPVSAGIEQAEIALGDMRLAISGDLAVGADGLLQGRLQVRAERWREILAALVALGLVPAEAAGTLETTFALVAAASGDPDIIDAPLVFEDRQSFFGPLPLGPAPRIR
ncbi:DUF2125 domain-containing protein [Rhodobacterales bacterium HKCCE2091]|nr:DUF2125 domain-containing protein [Rhodobacterales bacterium HKCCE2091]